MPIHLCTPYHQRCWLLNWILIIRWKVSLLFSPEDTASVIYIYSFSRRFYPKRLTIEEYNKRYIIKRQTVTGSAGTSQERGMKTFWKVILCLFVMAPRGVTHSQIWGFWRGCRLSSVSGSMRVLSLWLFYTQASVSWTWCELQPVASAGRQREVWHGPFWVRWRPIDQSESSVKVWSCMMEVQLEEHCSSPVWKWQGPGQEVVQRAV